MTQCSRERPGRPGGVRRRPEALIYLDLTRCVVVGVVVIVGVGVVVVVVLDVLVFVLLVGVESASFSQSSSYSGGLCHCRTMARRPFRSLFFIHRLYSGLRQSVRRSVGL